LCPGAPESSNTWLWDSEIHFLDADWIQKCHWQTGNVRFINRENIYRRGGGWEGKITRNDWLLYAQLALGSFMRGI
jgi:hypothetical protein